MVELTVSQVSGIIAAGVFVVQFMIPMATALILVALLSEDNNLMTWTQISRSLHSTYWPQFLRGDSSSQGAVRLPVKIESIMRTVLMMIVGIAAIVTPIGLYDTIVLSPSTVPHPFQYQKDTSPFGFGTPERKNLDWNRYCGYQYPLACPGSNTVVELSTIINDTVSYKLPHGYNLTLPNNITEAFQSGLKDMDPTVSSILDIEWRSFGFSNVGHWGNSSTFVTGKYRQLDTLVLNEGFQVVEGLIIDHENGGIGFRSHSIPVSPPYGAEWSEDLLFIEPHIECVNNNLTIDIEYDDDERIRRTMNLTDHGGFININTTYPVYHPTSQGNIDLAGRARQAAFLHNSYIAAFMNVTSLKTDDLEPWSYKNSSMGREFPIELRTTPDPQLLKTMDGWSLYDLSTMERNSTNSTNSTSGESRARYPNPYNVLSSEFSDITSLCETNGTTSGIQNGDISSIGIFCGMVLGAARRSDRNESRSLIFESGSKWSIPIYSCAGAAKASIKKVDFKFNGTDSLNSLTVTGIREKNYKSESAKPLWGVEKMGYYLAAAMPMWGLVSGSYAGKDELSVLRKESLWLPGYSTMGATFGSSGTSIPGLYFHMDAFHLVYSIGEDDPTFTGVGDYSGKTSMAMFKKWQDLSADAKGVSRILNSVWTDISANSVMGTRGWISNSDRNSQQKRDTVDVPVGLYHRRIRYRIPYGIPAFIALVCTFVVAIMTMFYALRGKATPSVMRKYLFHTAVGRIMGAYSYPGQTDRLAPADNWAATAGEKGVSVATPIPAALDPVMMGKRADMHSGPGHISITHSNAPPPSSGNGQAHPTHHSNQDDPLYHSTQNHSTASFSPLDSK